MSLSDTDVKAKYNANGITTTFAIPFPEVDEYDDEVEVMTINESSTPPEETVKTLTTHYTISGTNVVFLAAPSSGLKVLVAKKMDLVQTNFEGEANGPYPAAEAELGYDRLTNMIQILDEAIKRAAKFRKSYITVTNPELPDPSAGCVIAWNDDADALENGPTTTAIFEAEADAEAAAAAAASSQGAAATSASNAALSETAAETAQAAAEAAQAAAEAAQSAAEAAAAGAEGGQITVTDGMSATNITDATADGASLDLAEFMISVIRGTTPSWVYVYLKYDGTTWTHEVGEQSDTAHGITFSVTQAGTVAQLQAAADSSGNGRLRFARRAI